MKAIELNNIFYSYNDHNEALKGISLQIDRGSHIAFVGHNGSGKSTLARVIKGLLKPTKGDIYIDGIHLEEKNRELLNKVSIVFQNPDNQFIGATVEDDIAFGLENKCVDSALMKGLIEKYASKVNMLAYLESEPTMLSGGQKQRVAIAGALAMEPEILILDEATAMLDPRGKKEIFEVIKSMRKDNPNMTIISITHEIEEAYLSDYVYVLNNGKIEVEGSPKTIFSNNEIINKYHLNKPFLLSLKEQLQEHHLLDESEINNIDEAVEIICRLK